MDITTSFIINFISGNKNMRTKECNFCKTEIEYYYKN